MARTAVLRANRADLFVLCSWLSTASCQPLAPRTPVSGAESGSEIDLTRDSANEPEPASAKPPRRNVICREGEAQGCGLPETPAPRADQEKRAELDLNKRYSIAVSAADPALGAADAQIRIVVFSDYQCPYCRHLNDTLKQLRAQYPGVLQIVWKDLPLPSHPFARKSALLGRAAFEGGGNDKFWQLHDALYDKQPVLSDATLAELAARYDLVWPPTDDGTASLDRTLDQVNALGISSTPTTFVNGRPVVGAKPLSTFTKLVDEERQGSVSGAPTSATH